MKMKHWMFLIMGLVLGLDASLGKGQDPAADPGAPDPVPAPVEPGAPEPATPEPPTQPAAADAAAPLPATPDPAAPAPTGPTAIIKSNRVNVRAKASLNSEVVIQLNAGDRVSVLEQVTLQNPKPDEPEKWVRIALPPTVPVWVHGSFIDPATHTVKATQLNMRSGPGENHSVLGRISQGTPVMELESKDGWIKISPPDMIQAYVAAYLVTIEPGSTPPEVALVPPPPSTNDLVAATPPPPIPVEPVDSQPPPVAATETVPTDVAPDATEPPVVAVEPLKEPEPQETKETPPPKRIVRREGIVRRSVSIQAPTYFVLESLQGRKTINYLHTTNSNLVLQDYYGARIVVTGEEMLDERWPNTPVISIESLEAVP